jgi:hypothetical protein
MVIFSKFIFVVTNDGMSFIIGWYSTLYKWPFDSSFANGLLACFYIFTLLNNGAMNVWVQISLDFL